jgi:hypothetical protein
MLGNIIRSVRRNHALEHATISILLGRLGPGVRMVGRATRNGFYIYGDVPTDRVKESAAEGLARLKRGEVGLAVSPLCGTNLAVAGLLAGASSLLALGNRGRLERLPNVLLSAMVAVLAAQPLGRLVQRHVTTSHDLAGMEIVAVQQGGQGPARYHKVETRLRAS